MKIFRTIVWLLVGILVIFVLINWNFFAKRAGFYVSHDLLNRAVELEQPDIAGQPDRLTIPSLGTEAPLAYPDESDEISLQIALISGVAHYPGTALPGGLGNAFYFGHSSDFPTKPGNYKTVFALLPEIRVGDIINITDRTGRLFTYEVFNKQVVSSSQTEFLSQGDKSEKLLTLQTSYPVGTALKRYIVQAKAI